MNRKMRIALITGAILGVICIIGASVRSGGTQEVWYLFAFWFNRVLMGFVFGLLPVSKNTKQVLIRGLLVGLFVSFAFYSATNFQDIVGFIAGGVYGIIIEFILYKNIRGE